MGLRVGARAGFVLRPGGADVIPNGRIPDFPEQCVGKDGL